MPYENRRKTPLFHFCCEISFPFSLSALRQPLFPILPGPNRYTQRIILLVILWAAASSSFNIISGYAGQVVFGYMMFVGAGAYTTVLLFKFLAYLRGLGCGLECHCRHHRFNHRTTYPASARCLLCRGYRGLSAHYHSRFSTIWAWKN